MELFKHKNLPESKFEKAFLTGSFIFFIMQILFICGQNFFANDRVLGYDASSLFLLVEEMIKQGSLLPDGYVYQTTLGVSPVTLIAFFIGLVTKDAFFSVGIANILIIFVLLYLLESLFAKITGNITYKYLLFNLALCPFAASFSLHNDLGYFSLMFVSFPVYLSTIVLYFFTWKVFLDLKEGTPKNIEWVLSCLLIMVSAFSSGITCLIFSVLPCALFLLFQFLRENDINVLHKKQIVFLTCAVVSGIIGRLLCRNITKFTTFETTKHLIGLNSFFDNLQRIFLGFFELLGIGIYESDTPVISIHGFVILIYWCIILALICFFVYGLYRNRIRKNNLIYLCICNVLVNIGVYTLIDSRYGQPIFESRYLIIVFYSIALISISAIELLDNRLWFKRLGCILFLGLIMINTVSGYYVYYNTKIPESTTDIPKLLESYDSPVVYGLGSLMIPTRNLRVLDQNKVYKYVPDTTVLHWGDYTYYDEVSEHTGEVLVLIDDAEYELVDPYITRRLNIVEHSGNIGIYTASPNPFDFATGLPDKDKSIDFPYSRGYVTQFGYMTEGGTFLTDGTEGYALYGPYAPVKEGVYDIVLNYSVNEATSDMIGTFDVAVKMGNEIISSMPLTSSGNSIVLKNISFSNLEDAFEARVYNYSGSRIDIKSIEYIRK